MTGVTPVPPLSVTVPVWVPPARRRWSPLRSPAIAGAGAGAEGQPARRFTGAPGQGAAAGVADAEGLRGGVDAALDGGEREARGTCADGRWDRCRRDGEGDGDRDGGRCRRWA